MIYRIDYKVFGESMAIEYKTAADSEWHRNDISGYIGITECRVTPLEREREPKSTPFKSGSTEDPDFRPTIWERLSE